MSSKESVVKSEQQKRPARNASKRSLIARFATVTKTCVRCGKRFATDNARDMFCSFKCRDEQNAEYVKAVKIQFMKIQGRMPSYCEAEIRKAIVVLRAYLAKTNPTAGELLVGMGEIKACLDRAADFNRMLAII